MGGETRLLSTKEEQAVSKKKRDNKRQFILNISKLLLRVAMLVLLAHGIGGEGWLKVNVDLQE